MPASPRSHRAEPRSNQHDEFNGRYALLAPLKLSEAVAKEKGKGAGKQQQAGSRALLRAILPDLQIAAAEATAKKKKTAAAAAAAEGRLSLAGAAAAVAAAEAAGEDAWKAFLATLGLQLGLTKVFFRQVDPNLWILTCESEPVNPNL